MLKKVGKVGIWAIAVVIYLNIGWALGTFMHNDVHYECSHEDNRTVIGHFLAGPDYWVATGGNSLSEDQTMYSVGWSFVLVVVVCSWIMHGLGVIWPVFAGGIAKLLGVG